MEISDPRNIAAWTSDADELSGRIEVQSCGRSLEIVKDIGGAEQVSEKHKVHDMIGTHGLGHARLATESSVLPNASHPFWARPFQTSRSCITGRSLTTIHGATGCGGRATAF
ncbi:hypothetical protein [Sulfitobacter sediminilitoris]|uniref:hypothetical protein n=1 Tax=Sulfitobacter sediminilitoris TaxID=2698830 RepID=UPI0036065BA5